METKKHCERCGAPLNGGFTVSRFSTETICLECSRRERQHPDYDKVVRQEMEEIKKGNYNWPGPGWPGEGGRI